jgi:cytochrome c
VIKHCTSACLFSLLLLGCGGHTQQNASAASSSSGGSEAYGPTEAVPQTFADQVALGGQAYGNHCAGCHGAGGEGTQGAPAVVGLKNGALPLEPRAGSHRTAPFTTVADVANFVVATMPPKAPGSLSADEYWAILAFDLSANGINLDQKLTPELAATLTIPR